MNCFEFKKFSMSDPYSEDQGFLEHKAECQECYAYLKGILSFDKSLEKAISVGHVSPEFKARLKLHQVIEKQQQIHRTFRRLSYAAGIMLATVAGFFAVQSYQATQNFNQLYNQVATHIQNEPGSLSTVQATAQLRMQSHLAAYAGLDVPELSGLRYSQLCPIGKHKTWHASIDTPEGVVTVVLFKSEQMPDKSAAKQNQYIRIVKKSIGSFLLIGDSKQAVDHAYQQLTSSFGDLLV